MSLNLTSLKTVTCQRKSTPCFLQYANNNRKQGRFNDVTLQSSNTRIPANRMVLSCYCSFFDQIFASETNNQVNDSVFDIPDVDGNFLELLIQYIYTGQICIDSEIVFDILAGAHHLELNEVKEFCFELLENCMTPDNCITILITAKQYKNFTLRDKVYQHISDNYEIITKTPAFLNLDNEELFFIVYHLKTKFFVNDEVLCRSLLSWTKQDEETRKRHFHNKLIKFVKVNQFSLKLTKYLLKESLIQENADYYKLLNDRIIDLITKATKILGIGDTRTKTKVKVIYSLNEETNETYPDLPISLCYHNSIKVSEFVYVIGKKDCDNQIESNKAFRLDLSEEVLRWEEIASMNVKRIRGLHMLDFDIAMFDDTIVVCGGYDGSKCLSSAEAYNAPLNQWINIKPLNQNRTGNKSATSGGCLYTIGGYDEKKCLASVERLDRLDQSWKSVSSMQTSRCMFTAVSCGNIIYAIGGLRKFNDNLFGKTLFTYINVINAGILSALTFTNPIITVLLHEQCTEETWLTEDLVFNPLKSVEKYDSASDTWVYVSKMNIARWRHSAFVMEGKIFVVGGWNAYGKPVKEIECYDPSNDNWDIVSKIDDEFVAYSLVAV